MLTPNVYLFIKRPQKTNPINAAIKNSVSFILFSNI